jgi:anti-sigma factor RsiW
MTCRELTDFLADYESGDLDAKQKARFEDHLAECPDCVTYLRSYRDTIRLVKDACRDPDDPVPPEVPEELVRAIREARAKPSN